ncbi:LPD7 domain-containing protein [uncultured Variovorax sp.]|jgi:hypothetical protein|uniref:LPD7 domain-containing protein n=1 Tax=uncultured Variovorax sp. TaxID=114708 RepID=UPI00260498CC|nr:LPD7 domain-containing protein [uncultured Variovorax sp.]
MATANASAFSSTTTGNQQATAASNFAGAVQGNAAAPGRNHPPVPDAIERRYLRIDNSYLFPDRTLAFIDDGSRIRVRTENREVMHSVVAIAQQRGWQTIEVRGTEVFRQGMWREAELLGLEVRGYEPSESERQQVARAQMRQRPEETQGPAPGSPTPSAAADQPRPTRNGARAPIVGVLVAAAASPYRFDPQERMSFYVMVRTEVGDRTVWGTDLERALAESASQPRVGASVVLTHQGTTAVDVRVPQRDETGDLVGEKKIVAQRARWGIETIEYMRSLQQAAGMIRGGEPVAREHLAAQPSLAAAAAGVRLAEQYAERHTTDAPSRQRLVQAIRERLADAVEQGRDIHLPVSHTPTHAPHVRQRSARMREEPIHERH